MNAIEHSAKILLKQAAMQEKQKRENGNDFALISKKSIFKNAFFGRLKDKEINLFAKWRTQQLEKGNRHDLSWASFIKDFHTPDKECNTKLHEFVMRDQLTFLLACLHCDESSIYLGKFINCMNREGDTPLMIAVRKRRYGIAVLLLEYGADPNCRWDITCPTALHIAAMESNKDFAALLIHHGADAKDTYHDMAWDVYITSIDSAATRVRNAMAKPATDKFLYELNEAEAVYEYLLRSN